MNILKIYQGKIVGLKMAKTITVEVERILAHPIYKKRFKRSKKYHVHSENAHKIGDIVNFVECPPISKSKRWIEKVEKSQRDSAKAHLTGSREVTKSTSLGKSKKKGAIK